MMSFEIEQLKHLCSPPEFPKHTGNARQWNEIEQSMNIRFPQDYKEYASLYGNGGFYGLFGIGTPFAPNNRDVISIHNESRSLFSNIQNIFPVFPEKDGILYVGGDENGNCLFWRTAGSPEEWSVVYARDDFEEICVYQRNIVSFICGVLYGNLIPPFIADLTDCRIYLKNTHKHIFEPAKD